MLRMNNPQSFTPMRFHKMHGLGNDFVIFDLRGQVFDFTPELIARLGDRRRGIGFDQMAVIHSADAQDHPLILRMDLFNCDGSRIEACGNATRCVAWLLMQQNDVTHLRLRSDAGILEAWEKGDHRIAVDMGPPRFGWQDIPLIRDMDTLAIPVATGPYADAVGVSMGNPHAVCFVPDAAAVDLDRWGPQLENHAMFPAKANIEFVQVLGADHLRMRVWERGAGITEACGSGACAAVVAAVRKGMIDRKTTTVTLDGGDLQIHWQENEKKDENGAEGHVLMTGPVTYAYRGEIDLGSV